MLHMACHSSVYFLSLDCFLRLHTFIRVQQSPPLLGLFKKITLLDHGQDIVESRPLL